MKIHLPSHTFFLYFPVLLSPHIIARQCKCTNKSPIFSFFAGRSAQSILSIIAALQEVPQSRQAPAVRDNPVFLSLSAKSGCLDMCFYHSFSLFRLFSRVPRKCR